MYTGNLCMHNIICRHSLWKSHACIKVIPDPPANTTLLLSFSGKELIYTWDPPKKLVASGIKGYNLTFYGDCGTCTPMGLVNNTTFASLCAGWKARGQICHFEIRTVTEDCGLESEPANITSILNGRWKFILNFICIILSYRVCVHMQCLQLLKCF